MKFSIIVPVYNVEKFLRESLDSIISQTLKDFEVICVNDGSTDNSLEILKEYANKDSRIKVISQENQGQGVARNNAIDIAQGKYLLFVDPDDFIESNTLEVLYNKFHETDVDIIQFDYATCKEDGTHKRVETFKKRLKKYFNYSIKNNQIFNWHKINKKNLEGMYLAIWNKAYKTSFIKEHHIKFAPTKTGEDNVFSISSNLLANKILYINKVFYFYRTRTGSAVNKASNDNFDVFENMKILKDFLVTNNLYEEYKSSFDGYVLFALSWHFSKISHEGSEKYLEICREILDQENYELFLHKTKGELSILERIFSIKNREINGVKIKYLTICGKNFKLKQKTYTHGEMNIALGFDKGYLPHGAATIKSIIENNKNVRINFLIMINNSINGLDKYLLKNMIGKQNTVQFVDMDNLFKNQFEGCWSTAMYYPLILSSICKDDKILFLDADTIITGNLVDFYKTNLSNIYCAAVRDWGLNIQRKKSNITLKINNNGATMSIADFMHKKLKFSESDCLNYFNSGVLLLNLKKIRKDNLEKQMIQYVENNDLMFPDQDVLNLFFKDCVKLLPYNYNYQIVGEYVIDIFDEEDKKNYNMYIRENKKPLIIHFINKPFRNINKVPLGDKYYFYRNKTFWAFTIDENLRKKIIRLKFSTKKCYLYLLGSKIFEINIKNKELCN